MYEDITPESLKAQMLADIGYWSKNEGTMISTLMAPPAYAVWQWYMNLEAVQYIIFPDENSGPWIDKSANQYGIYRKEGAAASCIMTLDGTAGVKVPAGKVFQTASGVRFTTDADVYLPGSVGATCTEIGAGGNIDENELTIQGSVTKGLTGWSNTEAMGGIDDESDASLVSRYYERLQKPATSGNKYHYEQWAKSVAGVGAAKVFPLWNGPGTVKVVITSQNIGVPDETIVQDCADYIETVRPIGADVTVAAADGVNISIAASIVRDEDRSAEDIRSEFETELNQYFGSLAFKNGEIVYTEVGAILQGIKGVYDYSGLTINGGTVNVRIGDVEIPVLESVVLSDETG